MEDLVLLIVAAGLWLLVAPAWALVTAMRLRAEVRSLRAELAELRADASRPAVSPSASAEAMPPPVADAPAAPASPEAAAPVPPATVAGLAPARVEGLEQRLTQRWLVWLGGIALALGGAFVVKAAAEQGWLGPIVRMLAALAFGGGLVVLAERLRRRGIAGYVPMSLAAAGVSTLFAALWAGHALYGLLSAGPAFVLLAAVAALAVLLAWSHGPWLAALGLGGAFAVPALIDSVVPSPWTLAAYLLLPMAAGLVVLRYRPWPWLAWLVLVGTTLWLGLGLAAPWRADGPIIVLLLAASALFLLAPLWAVRNPLGRSGLDPVVSVAASAFALLMLLLHVSGQPSFGTSLGLLLLCVLPFLVGRISVVPRIAAAAPAVAAMLALLAWRLAPLSIGRELTGEAGIALPPLRLLPEQTASYVAWAAAIAAFYALAGPVSARGRQPGLWAVLSAAVPVVVLAIAYLRLSDLTPALSWSGLALALSLAELGLASWSVRHRTSPAILAAYAVGTVAALALACTLALERAWLTVALAAMLPAMGLIWRRLAVPGLRTAASALAILVACRVGLDPEMGRLLGTDGLSLGWIVYGLGLPLAAFLAASRLFHAAEADRLSAALATGALVLWLALAWALIRWLMHGSADPAAASLLAEWSLHGLVWLATGLGLLRRDRIAPWWPTRLGAALLCGLGGVAMLITLTDLNPLVTGGPVGRLPFANVLLLAYGLPALVLGLVARELALRTWDRPAAVVAALALSLVLLWLGLELRRSFHGTVLTGDTGSGESWAYTLLLLAYAAGLLAAGIRWSQRQLRLASLAVLMLAVAKAFLVDLGGLDGLWRAASFIGLGGCLVGIGFVYQRFVFDRPAEAS